jgi:hypothetical protein
MQQLQIDRSNGLSGCGASAESPSSALPATIWPGCTSNRLPNPASVFSPLIAAKAKFALKQGLCIRRVRSQGAAKSPLSGRKAAIELSDCPGRPLPPVDSALKSPLGAYSVRKGSAHRG